VNIGPTNKHELVLRYQCSKRQSCTCFHASTELSSRAPINCPWYVVKILSSVMCVFLSRSLPFCVLSPILAYRTFNSVFQFFYRSFWYAVCCHTLSYPLYIHRFNYFFGKKVIRNYNRIICALIIYRRRRFINRLLTYLIWRSSDAINGRPYLITYRNRNRKTNL